MDPRLVLLGGVAASVAGLMLLTVVLVGAPPRRSTGVARSLEMIERTRAEQGLARQELGSRDRLLAPLLDLLARLGRRLSPRYSPARAQRLLDFAGNPPRWTAEAVLAAKGGAVVLGGALGVLVGGARPLTLLLAPGFALLAGLLPDVLLRNAGQHRQEAVRASLADAMDMLTVCVEAGLGFEAALQQVARKTEGPFARELARMLQEVQLGRPRTEALQQMAERVDVHELQTFVTAVVQADRLGIPVARVLREQAGQMRLVRRQAAEERAQKITVKILFPVIFCILPALVVVIMGPAVIQLMETFSVSAPGSVP